MRDLRNDGNTDLCCADCGCTEFSDDDELYFGGFYFVCGKCADSLVRAAEGAECKLTSALPDVDDDEMTVLTHADFRRYFSQCRRECTNFDELVQGLDRDSLRYRVIKRRIEFLLRDAIETRGLDTKFGVDLDWDQDLRAPDK